MAAFRYLIAAKDAPNLGVKPGNADEGENDVENGAFYLRLERNMVASENDTFPKIYQNFGEIGGGNPCVSEITPLQVPNRG